MKSAFEILQFNGSSDEQKKLVAKELESISSFIILGKRPKGHPSMENFCSCSMAEHEIASAILNFMLIDKACANPILFAVHKYLERVDSKQK